MSLHPGLLQSRWIELPDGVEVVPDAPLAPGFRAAGVACGLKPDGVEDLGLLVCDEPGATSAAAFTDSAAPAAPVLLCRARCDLHALRAVVVNSGNANAATGRRGLEDAARCQGAGAIAARVRTDQVAVASTGVIGVPLDAAAIVSGLARAHRELDAGGAAAFSTAIRTTDAFEKRLTVRTAAGVTVSGQCKGAGMIAPGFATMLCFVQTDARVDPAVLPPALARTFARVSVDGQLSTNDSVFVMGSGRVDALLGAEELELVLLALALACVRDGEGARRVGRLTVTGGDQATSEHVARTVADSSLVKTALYGADPNWGRIAQAIGLALRGSGEPVPFEISVQGTLVCRSGAATGAPLADISGDEIEYAIGLPGTGAEAVVYFSDLGYEYVRINAEYTT